MQLSEFTYVFLIQCVPFMGYIVSTTNPKKGFTLLFSSIIFFTAFIKKGRISDDPDKGLTSAIELEYQRKTDDACEPLLISELEVFKEVKKITIKVNGKNKIEIKPISLSQNFGLSIFII